MNFAGDVILPSHGGGPNIVVVVVGAEGQDHHTWVSLEDGKLKTGLTSRHFL